MVGLLPLLRHDRLGRRAPRPAARTSPAAWHGSCRTSPSTAAGSSATSRTRIAQAADCSRSCQPGAAPAHPARPCSTKSEFLSDHGLRSLSRCHRERPSYSRPGGAVFRLDYEPAESTTAHFGGNSNWRGPVWFPVNYLILEALDRYHGYLGDGFRVEHPVGTGREIPLDAGRRRARVASGRVVPPRRQRPPAGASVTLNPSPGPSLARPVAVLRILRRRHRTRARRDSSDRLDRPCREPVVDRGRRR